MKTNIIPCICTDRESNSGDSCYYGMPIFITTNDMKYWEIQCPICCRGGMKQFKSPYLAVKDWNRLQTKLRTPLEFIPIKDGENE